MAGRQKMSLFKKHKKGDLGSCRLVSCMSVPVNLMEQLFLETISRHMKDKKVIRSSWHGFMKGKSYFTNIIAFYREVGILVDEGRAVIVIYLNFNKALDTVSYNNYIDKLAKYKSDKYTVG